MRDGRWVQAIIAVIVTGNLILLEQFFLVPRMQFLLAHQDLNRKQLMETAGARDMPNQLSQTYKVVNRIGELTSMNATIFMSPGDRLQGSFRSAAIQILYPRKILFGGDENFARVLKAIKKTGAVYFVYSPQWKPDFCVESSRTQLTEFGFGMCRLIQ